MNMQITGRFGPVAVVPAAGIRATYAQGSGQVSRSMLPKLAASMPAAHEIDAAVAVLNESIKPLNTSLQFAIDRDSRKVVVKLVDLETGEVIRQYPSEELLALAKAKDLEAGSLLKALA